MIHNGKKKGEGNYSLMRFVSAFIVS